jgi:hypothetical protein
MDRRPLRVFYPSRLALQVRCLPSGHLRTLARAQRSFTAIPPGGVLTRSVLQGMRDSGSSGSEPSRSRGGKGARASRTFRVNFPTFAGFVTWMSLNFNSPRAGSATLFSCPGVRWQSVLLVALAPMSTHSCQTDSLRFERMLVRSSRLGRRSISRMRVGRTRDGLTGERRHTAPFSKGLK